MVRPLSPETFSATVTSEMPDSGWSGHFRLRHPRNSDIEDALPHGGPTALAGDILAILGSEMP